MTAPRVEVVTYDTLAGKISFPGLLLAQAERRGAGLVAGVRVYRGTHEADGTYYVCGNCGEAAKPREQYCFARSIPSRSELLTFLAGDSEGSEEPGDALAFAAMADCLAQMGEGN